MQLRTTPTAKRGKQRLRKVITIRQRRQRKMVVKEFLVDEIK
jgi:hypothetical protein